MEKTDTTIAQAGLKQEYIEKAMELLAVSASEANQLMSEAGGFAAAQVMADIIQDGILEIEVQMQSSVPTDTQFQVLTPNVKFRAKLDISENPESIKKFIDSATLLGWINYLKPFIDRWAAIRGRKK